MFPGDHDHGNKPAIKAWISADPRVAEAKVALPTHQRRLEPSAPYAGLGAKGHGLEIRAC